MGNRNLDDYKINEISQLFYDNVGAIILIDPAVDAYKTIVRRGMFERLLQPDGIYHDLILDLWFHFEGSSEKISGDYQIFADNT